MCCISSGRTPHVNLAVVGARGVGKSTFIQCALDMKHPPLSRSCTKKMSLEGVVYVVRLLEISLQEITFDGSEHLVWPQSLDDQALPIIDGVIVLHDVTNPSSITECSRILSECYPILGSCVVVFNGVISASTYSGASLLYRAVTYSHNSQCFSSVSFVQLLIYLPDRCLG